MKIFKKFSSNKKAKNKLPSDYVNQINGFKNVFM